MAKTADVSQSEINAKLIALNLTTDPDERKKQHLWFVNHKIPLFFHRGWAVLKPEGVTGAELHSRLEHMDTLRDELQNEIKLMKERGLKVVYEKVNVDKETVGYHTVRNIDS